MKRHVTWLEAVLLVAGLWGYAYSAAAYYDPGMQRWINRDPVEEQGGVNLFSPGRNDCVNNLDPFGENTLEAEPPRRSPPIVQPPGSIFPSHPLSVDKDSCQVSSSSGNAPPARPPGSTGYRPCSNKGAKRNISEPYKSSIECRCSGKLEQTCTSYEECTEGSKGVLSGIKPVLEWTPKTACSPKGCPEDGCG